MTTPVLVQGLYASVPALEAVERAARLYALHESTRFEGERSTSLVEAERLSREWVLGSRVLRAYAPRGSKCGLDDGVALRSGVPHFRSCLALIATAFHGFLGRRPWYEDGGDFALRVFGTRAAVDGALALYAGLDAYVSSFASWSPPETVDEFLFGFSLGIRDQVGEFVKHRDAEEQRADRTKMVVYSEAVAFDAGKNFQDPNSALQRGIRASQGRGRVALGIRPPPPPPGLQVVFFGGSGTGGRIF